MKERKKILVTLYCNAIGIATPPTQLHEYIKWLTEKLNEIPEEYRQSAHVQIFAEDAHGSLSYVYTIEYIRPETDEEVSERTKKENLKQCKQRKHDLELLQRIKQKYNIT